MLMPTVYRYMTLNPYTVEASDPMSVAHRLMREYGFRHLPVVEGGKLIGIVSDRDLHLLEALDRVDPQTVTVAEAMTHCVQTAAADTPLDEVVEMMSSSRCNSIVVTGKTGIVGIFTATDALWALTDLLRREAA